MACASGDGGGGGTGEGDAGGGGAGGAGGAGGRRRLSVTWPDQEEDVESLARLGLL